MSTTRRRRVGKEAAAHVRTTSDISTGAGARETDAQQAWPRQLQIFGLVAAGRQRSRSPDNAEPEAAQSRR